jgi:hypothetical protein
MSNDYATTLLVNQRIADLHHEAEQDRLGRLARQGQPRARRWWERLMLFRSGSPTTAAADAAHRPAATVVASNSPG